MKVLVAIIGAFVLAAIVLALGAWVLQICWNGSLGLHTLFGTPEIAYTTAVDAVVVVSVLGGLFNRSGASSK